MTKTESSSGLDWKLLMKHVDACSTYAMISPHNRNCK